MVKKKKCYVFTELLHGYIITYIESLIYTFTAGYKFIKHTMMEKTWGFPMRLRRISSS